MARGSLKSCKKTASSSLSTAKSSSFSSGQLSDRKQYVL